jgi:uncharacterized protein (TIGR02453 family)
VTQYFDAASLKFLRDLAKNNDREWFAAHKETYETRLKDPMLKFITDLGPRMAKISKAFVVDPRPTGGSMFRIYRDTRFAKDKSPYKTHVAAHFSHAGADADGTAPGFYLSIEPGESMLGAGIWHPEPRALKGIRDAIVKDTKGWQKATSAAQWGSACGMSGESLKRPPPGYDPAHPAIEDLKRKDFAVHVRLTDKDVTSDKLMDTVIDGYRKSVPFVKFLSRAVGVDF